MEDPAEELVIAEALIAQMQAATEADKTELARSLHDELGALMVAAAMDLSSASHLLLRSVSESQPSSLDRAKTTLEVAIQRSRQMIEELRPTILDNFGLFAALKWQLQRFSTGSNALFTESYPLAEPRLSAETATGLFRIAQEALVMTFKRRIVTTVDFDIWIENDTFSMRLTDDGIPLMSEGLEIGASLALASMRYRSRVFGGMVEIERTSRGSTILIARLPLPPP